MYIIFGFKSYRNQGHEIKTKVDTFFFFFGEITNYLSQLFTCNFHNVVIKNK